MDIYEQLGSRTRIPETSSRTVRGDRWIHRRRRMSRWPFLNDKNNDRLQECIHGWTGRPIGRILAQETQHFLLRDTRTVNHGPTSAARKVHPTCACVGPHQACQPSLPSRILRIISYSFHLSLHRRSRGVVLFFSFISWRQILAR